ncbi:TraB/GumN family protein [Stakelama tenebrarum]|uniref:TraB/GumN family protein n=1 Tax=Stakelama tenebrarum TaxID=2711215 RepID=UPI001D18C2D5|nr:TraB/GumN family protein [Sphingosinithalassobacter tenebrarum]
MLAAACRPAPQRNRDADPALWIVQDEDTTIYLFGTIHVLKPGLSWFDEGVREAFDASDTLTLETIVPDDATMQALVRELGTDAAAPPLRERLSPAMARKLEKALADEGISPGRFDAMDPWLAATTLASLEVSRLGYARADGAEQVLREAARQSGKQIRGLETPREQLGYFDGLSMQAQQALLAATLDEQSDTEAMLARIVEAWSAGDTKALADLINADVSDSPELVRTLLVERNARWAQWIAARMERPGTIFVAVGAGHLAGETSVQAMLARRGLETHRVAY